MLDARFFGSGPSLSLNFGDLDSEATERGERVISTLDALLATTYSRSQIYLSRQLAQLHPELTMPMFSGSRFLSIFSKLMLLFHHLCRDNSSTSDGQSARPPTLIPLLAALVVQHGARRPQFAASNEHVQLPDVLFRNDEAGSECYEQQLTWQIRWYLVNFLYRKVYSFFQLRPP